jgi:hypothetical protein
MSGKAPLAFMFYEWSVSIITSVLCSLSSNLLFEGMEVGKVLYALKAQCFGNLFSWRIMPYHVLSTLVSIVEFIASDIIWANFEHCRCMDSASWVWTFSNHQHGTAIARLFNTDTLRHRFGLIYSH